MRGGGRQTSVDRGECVSYAANSVLVGDSFGRVRRFESLIFY